MEKLLLRFRSLIENVDTHFLRYNHQQIDWKDRMIAILGPRGVGKTTLLLQHIKLNHSEEDTIYISVDDLYFSEHKLLDFAEEFHRRMGGKYLFIDEIHKYAGWSKELKLIYDYFPELHIVFTGSSMLDIFKGSDDLSRRALLYRMYGMSFREYLNMYCGVELPTYTLEQILRGEVKTNGVDFPLFHFKEYLQKGYYPFSKLGNYEIRLLQTVQTILETDIPLFAKLNATTVSKLKQLIVVLAKSVPFKPNYTKLAEIVKIDRQTLTDYISYMEKAGLVKQLHDGTKGIRGLGKIAKLYLENSNLAYALGNGNSDIGNIRETFFFNQLAVNHDVTSSDRSDFQIGKYTFEIGGRNKGKQQIADIENAYVVKDDIEHAVMNTIPLWHFGFLY